MEKMNPSRGPKGDSGNNVSEQVSELIYLVISKTVILKSATVYF